MSKDINCPYCGVCDSVIKLGATYTGRKRYACKECKTSFYNQEEKFEQNPKLRRKATNPQIKEGTRITYEKFEDIIRRYNGTIMQSENQVIVYNIMKNRVVFLIYSNIDKRTKQILSYKDIEGIMLETELSPNKRINRVIITPYTIEELEHDLDLYIAAGESNRK